MSVLVLFVASYAYLFSWLSCLMFIWVICSLKRLKELHTKEPCNKGKMLRLCVEAGGCSGFQFAFLPDDKTNADDRLVGYVSPSL